MTSTQLELETTTLSEKIQSKLLRYKLHKKENTMRKVGYQGNSPNGRMYRKALEKAPEKETLTKQC